MENDQKKTKWLPGHSEFMETRLKSLTWLKEDCQSDGWSVCMEQRKRREQKMVETQSVNTEQRGGVRFRLFKQGKEEQTLKKKRRVGELHIQM